MKIKNFKGVDFLILVIYASVVVFVFMGVLITGLKLEVKRNYEPINKTEDFAPEQSDCVISVSREPQALMSKTVYKEDTLTATENYNYEELVEDEKEEPKITYNERYESIEITDDDIELMARIVFLEANVEPFAGQRMVVEVILNRVLHGDMGGSTIHDVIYAKNQFSTAKNVPIAKPTEQNYLAIYTALTETPITDLDVVYFARSPHNNSVFAKVGDHYFCYKY